VAGGVGREAFGMSAIPYSGNALIDDCESGDAGALKSGMSVLEGAPRDKANEALIKVIALFGD
jgi:hypothetical protein